MKLFAPKTVDSVVATLLETIKKLQEVASTQTKEAEAQEAAINAAITAKQNAEAEAARALSISEKLQGLVQ